MIPLIPTLISVAVSGASKLIHWSDSAPADGKAATGTTDRIATANPGANSDFQSLLELKNGMTQGAQQTQLANLADSPPAAAGDAAPVLAVQAAKPDAKTNSPAVAPTAPGTDMAALIGAAAAAGQTGLQHGASAALSGTSSVATGDKFLAPASQLNAAADRTGEPATTSTPLTATGTARNGAGATGDNATSAVANTFASSTPAPSAALLAAADKPAGVLPGAAQLHAEPPSLASIGVTPPLAGSASANVPQAPSTPAATTTIDTPIGAQGWDQALGQRVVWMVAQKNPTAELHVNPPELGPLSVTVSVANNTASATFVAAHAATRDAIADAMPRLRDMLAQSGIALGQVSVSAESFSQGSGAGAGQPNIGGRDAASGTAGATSPVGAAPASPLAAGGRALQGLVDTFA